MIKKRQELNGLDRFVFDLSSLALKNELTLKGNFCKKLAFVSKLPFSLSSLIISIHLRKKWTWLLCSANNKMFILWTKQKCLVKIAFNSQTQGNPYNNQQNVYNSWVEFDLWLFLEF